MSRRIVVIISVITLALFFGLVQYGWQNRWGGQSQSELLEPPVLSMPRLQTELGMGLDDFDAAVWQEIPALTVRLLHQVTTAPRGRNLVPEVRVRAFLSSSNAYFLLEWDDTVESRTHDVGIFPDGVAVGFWLDDAPPSESIMMGFESPVNMWYWRGDLDAEFWDAASQPKRVTPNRHYTYEKAAGLPVRISKPTSACQELLAARAGSLTPKEQTSVSGRGRWRDGKWRVIIKRPLDGGDPEESVRFTPGRHNMALAVWDGDKGDRGSRKSMSDWVVLDVGAAGGDRSGAALGDASQYSPAATEQRAGAPLSSAGMTGGPYLAMVTLAAIGEEPDDFGTKEEPRVITVKAKRFVYNPSEIPVRRGEWVTLRLESLDVTHGLYLDGYEINLKARPGKVGKATFQVTMGGRFTFRCSETCGEFHPYMIGFMHVSPNNSYRLFIATTAVVFVGALVLLGLAYRKKQETVADA